MGKIRNIRNLGPATEEMLAEVDIHSEEELREIGAVAAYQRMVFRFGRNVSLNALYAMAAGLEDVDWRALDSETKQRLRDSIKLPTDT
ncbi:TfoX/Sxy family protein [Pseudahrensia aquimaris]|uniref:TfoX/Sxy family protein n=1 Tax=Pseudahrensia aquimaris TaxID=744461 RepID=A0ABW3FEP0_9HYPH